MSTLRLTNSSRFSRLRLWFFDVTSSIGVLGGSFDIRWDFLLFNFVCKLERCCVIEYDDEAAEESEDDEELLVLVELFSLLDDFVGCDC